GRNRAVRLVSKSEFDLTGGSFARELAHPQLEGDLVLASGVQIVAVGEERSFEVAHRFVGIREEEVYGRIAGTQGARFLQLCQGPFLLAGSEVSDTQVALQLAVVRGCLFGRFVGGDRTG